ncbi:hypothetical protein ARTTLWGJ_CDS0041 [Staphylococcus phage PG-2021_35]
MMGTLDATFLISKVTEQMDEKGIELTDIKINDDSVTFNNSVNISLFYCTPHNIMKVKDLETSMEYSYSILYSSLKNITSRTIDILVSQQEEWLPGDDIEAYGEWFTLVVEESSYYAEKNQYQVYRLLDENYSLSDRMTLEDLKENYTNASLEKRLKE